MPLLNWVVLLVLTISIYIDETNLLRVLYPAPQSDEAVVKCILVFVMPLAVLFHLYAARCASRHVPRDACRPVQPPAARATTPRARAKRNPTDPGRSLPHASQGLLLGARHELLVGVALELERRPG